MALGDPDINPLGMDPAIADALAQQQAVMPDWSWAPNDWNEVGTIEYTPGGVIGQPNPPKPPPPPPQRIGGTEGVIETAAAPALDGTDPNEIEMPAENMRPVTIGQPRAPGVGTLLGAPTVEQPADFAPDPLSLIHEGQFNQTGLDQLPPSPSGFVSPADAEGAPTAGIKPEKSFEELGVEYGQDPVKLMIAEQDHARRQREWSDEQARIARNRDALKAEENHQRLLEVQSKTQADVDKLNADATALSKVKIDGGRWYRDRSTAGKIGAWVAAVVGGLVAGRTGGPNTGLQNILKMIDDDVEAQKADLQNQHQALGVRRGIISDEYARGGDSFRAAEAFRLASYDRTIADLQSQAQQFDPRSSRAIEIGKLIQGVAAQRQAAQAAALDRYYKLHTADADLRAKLLANASAEKKLAGIGMGSPKITRAQIAADYGFDPGRDMTDKELDKLLERKGKVYAMGADERKQATEERKDQQELGMAGLKQADGSSYKAPDKETARELRKKLAAADQIVGVLDRIRHLRDKVGGESTWVNSDYAQEYEVLKQDLVMLKKAGTEGMSSDADMARIEKALGAENPAGFRSQAAGLDVARERTVQTIRGAFQKQGNYTGNLEAGPLAFNNAYDKPAVETEADKVEKRRGYLQTIIDSKQADRGLKEWAQAELTKMTVGDPTLDDPRASQAGAREPAPGGQ